MLLLIGSDVDYADYLWMLKGFNFVPGAMETAEDEWWVRMELAETIDYSVRGSAPGLSNPELMDTTSASIPTELLASPIQFICRRTLCTHNYCDQEEGHCTESLRCICCNADWIFSR
ncbi:hypothetical protein CDAR_393281 [Caerostris darwini]|uniref:Uncharacterized protein n=1 Tax=Caerostris darwini TaxID=1538125 RepID=A0AAV4NX87_9ARAC|nr:hypothetical protein CDAR_393281 [Caerostris darwini]